MPGNDDRKAYIRPKVVIYIGIRPKGSSHWDGYYLEHLNTCSSDVEFLFDGKIYDSCSEELLRAFNKQLMWKRLNG